MTQQRMSGVLCPVITPFKDDLSPDANRLTQQCRWLLSQNVGLAVFGTNSEANSLSVAEKITLLEALVDAGIDTARLMPGTGCCSLSDSVELTKRAVELQCSGALMLPPFYYKGVSDDGLFAYYSEVIERVASHALQIYLYHIPPIAQVGLSVDLIERLIVAYPDTIAGIKDSSGDWDNTKAMLDRQWDNFQVFCGAETFLLQTMRDGGAGCISATANINPAAIDRLFKEWESEHADEQQSRLNVIREIAVAYPMIAALKATVAHFSRDDQWRVVRPPLNQLPGDLDKALIRALLEQDFDMPGIAND